MLYKYYFAHRCGFFVFFLNLSIRNCIQLFRQTYTLLKNTFVRDCDVNIRLFSSIHQLNKPVHLTVKINYFKGLSPNLPSLSVRNRQANMQIIMTKINHNLEVLSLHLFSLSTETIHLYSQCKGNMTFPFFYQSIEFSLWIN